MWVDPSAPVILKGKLRMLDGSPAFPSCTVSKATGTTCKLRNRDLIIIMRAILWALWCQGGPTLHIIMYRAPENCFRATWGHAGPFGVKQGHSGPILCYFRPIRHPCGPLKRPRSGPIWLIIIYYAPENCFRATWAVWDHAVPF